MMQGSSLNSGMRKGEHEYTYMEKKCLHEHVCITVPQIK